MAPPQKRSSQGKCGLINQIIMMMFLFPVDSGAEKKFWANFPRHGLETVVSWSLQEDWTSRGRPLFFRLIALLNPLPWKAPLVAIVLIFILSCHVTPSAIKCFHYRLLSQWLSSFIDWSFCWQYVGKYFLKKKTNITSHSSGWRFKISYFIWAQTQTSK